MRFDVLPAHRRLSFWIPDNERERPLSPARVLDTDHRALRHPGAMHDDVLELKGGNPFAAGLDHILDAVGDPQVAVGSYDSDVVRMEVAPSPELFRRVGVVKVALRQPGRADDDLARRGV